MLLLEPKYTREERACGATVVGVLFTYELAFDLVSLQDDGADRFVKFDSHDFDWTTP